MAASGRRPGTPDADVTVQIKQCEARAGELETMVDYIHGSLGSPGGY